MSYASAHNPALDYPEACRRIEAWRSGEDVCVNPLARTLFLHHGRKTDRAIVLLHGYTSSPRMYRQLAEGLHALGFNVLVPLAPLHGLADRLNTAFSGLTQKMLLDYLNEATDIAHGLGDRVGLGGFSMGGVLALWAARHRSDLDFVAAISPALAYRMMPLRLTKPLFRILRALPNRYLWWDHALKAEAWPRSHGYPRCATHGVAAFTLLGARIRSQSLHRPPAARKVRFILNPCDEALNNAIALEICRAWQKVDGSRTQLDELDVSLQLRHDFIDPEQPGAKIEQVYPVLLGLLSDGW